jgi:hypothetical protein
VRGKVLSEERVRRCWWQSHTGGFDASTSKRRMCCLDKNAVSSPLI